MGEIGMSITMLKCLVTFCMFVSGASLFHVLFRAKAGKPISGIFILIISYLFLSSTVNLFSALVMRSHKLVIYTSVVFVLGLIAIYDYFRYRKKGSLFYEEDKDNVCR